MTATKPKSRRAITRGVLARVRKPLAIDELAHRVRNEMGEKIYREKAWEDFKRGVASDARARAADGLPYAAEINGGYLPRSEWKPEHYQYAMQKLVRSAQTNLRRAAEYGNECKTKHEVEIDFGRMIEELEADGHFDRLSNEVVAS